MANHLNIRPFILLFNKDIFTKISIFLKLLFQLLNFKSRKTQIYTILF